MVGHLFVGRSSSESHSHYLKFCACGQVNAYFGENLFVQLLAVWTVT